MHNRVRSASGSPFCQARRAAGPVPGMDRSVSVIFAPRRHRLTPRLFKRNLSQMTSKIRTFGRTCDRFEEILSSPLPVAQPCILSLLFGCRTATKKPPKGGFSSGICPSFLDGGKQEVSYAGRPLPQVPGPKSQKRRGSCRCVMARPGYRPAARALSACISCCRWRKQSPADAYSRRREA